MTGLISPLGGRLVDRRVQTAEEADTHARAQRLASLELTAPELADLRLLGGGAYSPLTGFMTRSQYESVVTCAALPDDTPWTLPITLAVRDEQVGDLREGDEVALRDDRGELVGLLVVSDVFRRDVDREAREVYRTTDDAHPGVLALRARGDVLVGGDVSVLSSSFALDRGALDPVQARAAFAERGWQMVVAFQTRNPIHRAHEYLTKVALEQVDGLFVHPLVGATKEDDTPAEVRLRCYEVLLEGYYPRERVLMSTFPAAMRYAGPREAIFHGLVRRNYGCSHFIIGRDAAGVGGYYGTYDAQRLYDELGGASRFGFHAFKFEHTFHCRACDGMASTRTCPHGPEHRLVLSGTRLRELLRTGASLPPGFTRPEVGTILRETYAGALERAS